MPLDFFQRSRLLSKNPKRDPLGSLNVFLQTEGFKKIEGVPFERIQKFSLESFPLVSPTFWMHKKTLWFKAGLEPTLSCFSDLRKLVSQEVEQMNKKSGPIALN